MTGKSAPPPAATAGKSETAVKPKRSWPWVLVLVALGAGGIYLAAPSTTELAIAWQRLRAHSVAVLAIVIAGAVGLVFTEALRIAVVGRLVGARVGRRDAWDAAVANHVMTAITPQVGLGEPTVAYVLEKRGVPWDAAVAIPFVKFTTSLALVFALGAACVALGYGPPLGAAVRWGAVAWFGTIALVTLALLVLVSRVVRAHRVIDVLTGWLRRRWLLRGATWQRRIARVAEVAAATVERLERVMRWRGALALVAIHLLYYASYVAPLVGLALVLGEPPFGTLLLRSLIYLCFVFAMPTPGGAGPSEAAAAVMFGDLVGATDAIVVVVVFRAATFYLQLAIGAVYLPLRSVARSRA